MTGRESTNSENGGSPLRSGGFGPGADPGSTVDVRRLTTANHKLLASAWKALETVVDPEIPVLSVIELGIIVDVRLAAERIAIDVTPTFVACPAISIMRDDMREAVAAACGCDVEINIVFDPPWSSDRISSAGRAKLTAFGLAPPRAAQDQVSVPEFTAVPCPHCDSRNTQLESPFGPTLCRSIHYCKACRQSFEHFKPI